MLFWISLSRLFQHFQYVGCNCRFSTGRFGKGPSADQASNLAACAAEDDLFVFAVVALYAQEPALRSLSVVCHFYYSLNSNFFALKQGLWWAFLHVVQRYLSQTRFVGLSPPGTLENFPLFPIPVCLFFCLAMRVMDEALPFLTLSTTCSVWVLQNGQ